MNEAKTTAKDFFLWLGALITLYTAATTLITLLFDYINYTFPDPLAGSADPYGASMRFSMALILVATPATLILFSLIRKSIAADESKSQIWIRRWGLMLTLFVASAVALGDVATLINYFLGGEITMRFALKVLVVLLVTVGAFLHFYADLHGYWQKNPSKSKLVGAAVAVLMALAVCAAFFVIGSPSHIRDLRYDDQRTSDLSMIQNQILSYYQQKQKLPASIEELTDPLVYFTVPTDPQTGSAYEYSATNRLEFTLCATFSTASADTKGKGAYGRGGGVAMDIAYPSSLGLGSEGDIWKHEPGRTCFTRTIDPDKFPQIPVSLKGL